MQFTEIEPWNVGVHPDAQVEDVPGRYTVSDCRWLYPDGTPAPEEGPWTLFMAPDGEWKPEWAAHHWSAFEPLPDRESITSPRGRMVSITPQGHPRVRVHFPAHIPRTEWYGSTRRLRVLARTVAVRPDNGPAYDLRPNQYQLDLTPGDRVKIIDGELPPPPPPGLAYPDASWDNPAPIGGGACYSYGTWTEVEVEVWTPYPPLSAIWGRSISRVHQ